MPDPEFGLLDISICSELFPLQNFHCERHPTNYSSDDDDDNDDDVVDNNDAGDNDNDDNDDENDAKDGHPQRN